MTCVNAARARERRGPTNPPRQRESKRRAAAPSYELGGGAYGRRRKKGEQIRRQPAARVPIFESNDLAGSGIQLPQTRLDFFRDDRLRVVALESEPRNVRICVVVAVDLHEFMLPPPPHGHDSCGVVITAIRMVVDHDNAPDLNPPIARTRVANAGAVTLKHPSLDVCPRNAQDVRLDKRVLAPCDI